MGKDPFQISLMNLQGSLYNFALSLTSNRDDARDLTQDTTLKALDNKDRYSENSNMKGWLYTIMRNIFINNYHRQSRNVALLEPAEDVADGNSFDIVELEYPEDSYTCLEITDAINSLPEEYGLPFSMHVAGYKYEEIAEALSMPLGTVKSRIYSTRRRLQTRFAAYN